VITEFSEPGPDQEDGYNIIDDRIDQQNQQPMIPPGEIGPVDDIIKE